MNPAFAKLESTALEALHGVPSQDQRTPKLRLQQSPSFGIWQAWLFLDEWRSPSGLADLQPVVIRTSWDHATDRFQLNDPIESLKWVGRSKGPTIDVQLIPISSEILQAVWDPLGNVTIPLSSCINSGITLDGCRRSLELFGPTTLKIEWQEGYPNNNGLDDLDRWFYSALELLPK